MEYVQDLQLHARCEGGEISLQLYESCFYTLLDNATKSTHLRALLDNVLSMQFNNHLHPDFPKRKTELLLKCIESALPNACESCCHASLPNPTLCMHRVSVQQPQCLFNIVYIM